MELVVVLVLVLINGFFSMSEISVVSSRKSKLDAAAKKGNKTCKQVLKVSENPDKFLSTVQISITAIGLITGMYSGESLTKPLAEVINRAIPDLYTSQVVSRIVIILLTTYVTLVLGELFPKKLGMNAPEKIAGVIIKPMNFLAKIFYPFVWLLSVSTQGLSSLFGIKKHSNAVTEDEIKLIINDSAKTGEIQEVEQDIVDRVFSLGDRDIASLMTHRTEFEWLDANDSLERVKQRLAKRVHYIYPVADGSLDRIVGVVYQKDLFNSLDAFTTIRNIMRKPQYLHESMSVYDALESFKMNKIHYALIIDEFGMVEGMVTMNDILESIVGSSSEFETEDDENEFLERSDGTYLVGGQYSFYDFLCHFDLEDLYQDNNYNTLSGLIFSQIGVIPKEGDKIEWERFVFEIIDMDSTRIDKVLVSVKPELPTGETEE